jgi:hypothetical protein
LKTRWSDVEAGLRQWRDDAVAALTDLRRDTAIFTHFIAANAIVGAVIGSADTIVYRPSHASITELALEDGVLRIVRLGAEMRSEDVR